MKIKILRVCLASIDPLPLSKGDLKSKIDSNKVLVDSTGNYHWHIGNKSDTRSVKVSKKTSIR